MKLGGEAGEAQLPGQVRSEVQLGNERTTEREFRRKVALPKPHMGIEGNEGYGALVFLPTFHRTNGRNGRG
jgi:hypothetical protein